MISSINTKKIRVVLSTIILIFSFSIPVFSYAQVTNTGGIVYECNRGAAGECNFDDLIAAIQNLVTVGRNIALEISVIVLAIAGFKYMTSGGNASKRTESNKMLLNVVYGIIFILAAWLIVNLITSALLNPNINTFMS